MLKDGELKNRMIFTLLGGRIAFIAMILLLWWAGGYNSTDVTLLLYIVFALTCAFITLFVRLIRATNRYLVNSGESGGTLFFAYAFLIILHAIQITAVILKAAFNIIDSYSLYTVILISEGMFGVCYGSYFNKLFPHSLK